MPKFNPGGRLIPLNKKDGGIRPIVVGEVLCTMVAKLAFKEAEMGLTSPSGVGSHGPVIQAAILAVKSWVHAVFQMKFHMKFQT